ncbi:MAG: hypothetical protein LBB38_00040 [Puniceicoccales bacterium]|jgi:uncharacterized protein YdeI (YjbR/CyaY-like superfamily)|nr:hypothetical protein [Puniceicoccales bacterium]
MEREYLCPQSQEEWRRWLEKNGSARRDIWLLFHSKASNRKSISYLQALEEALCFGWIDGMVKRYDGQTLSQRFSPRAKNSSWSEVNKQHARILVANGKMAPAGMAVLPDLDPNAYVCPQDILDELCMDGEVWEKFCALPAYYRNIRIAAIDMLRKDMDRFRRALDIFIARTRQNRRYGRFR